MPKKVGFQAFLGTNYGTVLQSFALYQTIKNLGYECEIIGCDEFRHRKEPDPSLKISNPKEYDKLLMQKNFENFINKWFNFNEILSKIPGNAVLSSIQKEEIDKFDAFVCGSDQIWKPGTFWFCAKRYLQFAPEDKRIGYAPSVGWNRIPEQYKNNIELWSKWLSSVRYLSTRESIGSSIISKITGRTVSTVLDPTLLLDIVSWEKIIPDAKISDEIKSIISNNKKYIVAYLLDTYEINKDFIISLADKINANIVWLTGRDNVGPVQRNCAETNPAGFVKLIKNASFVCADGYHGTCFSLNFSKSFIVFQKENTINDSRMYDLLKRLGVNNRIITRETSLKDVEIELDYSNIKNNIKIEQKKSLEYLNNALLGATEKKGVLYELTKTEILNNKKHITLGDNKIKDEVEKLHKNSDYIKIRYLVTLLKDYGVKHIVLSPGGRDVPIVRMFEYNEKYFTLHMVTDERSAAYYGLGIASQLRKPVVCVCTSGTAASNFLPAITEAYYTQIPLILITADRYEVYHEQGEDQTIPQKDIYKGVVKKSITLPEGSGWMVERQIKRDIQDCILETIHNNFGPVHINIGIDNVNIGAKIDKKYWTLLPKITPHLLRVSLFDGKEKIQRWINALKKSNKILLVYGQNYLPTPQQKYYIESFASKYNCVIVTDLISNLSCSYSVDPYNMLKNISNQEFNDKLSPDIVITIGGKRLMNDPLTSKIRNGLSNIRHWSVTPNGKVKDFYFHLSSIIEMSQDCFFEYFSNNSGNILNNGIYYEQWRKLIDTISVKEINEFDTNYIQNKFLPNIPKNSILHLGVGLNFYTSRKYKVDKSIYVYCNMGTNGIDGCTSTFMGQCSVIDDKLCFLLVGDLSFFYDMNSIWNKTLKSNIRILMINNNGSGLLRGNQLKFITSQHGTKAEGWVKSTGFTYLSANSKEEFDEKLPIFLDINIKRPLFFEVFCK